MFRLFGPRSFLQKFAAAEWREEHEATCDQYEFCKPAVLEQQRINSNLADEIAEARFKVEVVPEVMQEQTEEVEKEIYSAQEECVVGCGEHRECEHCAEEGKW